MPFFQKLMAKLFSKETMAAMEADSKDWIVRCPCGHETSVWELGGIRYGARSTGKRTMFRCQKCGKLKWHRFYRKSLEQPPT